MIYNLEDVFVTEGVPEFTFVEPPNYAAILIDIRRAGKPVIIEGQSGTGKTTSVKQILKKLYPLDTPHILTPREPGHEKIIGEISIDSGTGIFVIDDFHRLNVKEKERLADLAKVIAERDNRSGLPKLVILGINNVGSDLIQLVPDIAKRMGIHRVQPGTKDAITKLITAGCEKLKIKIQRTDEIFAESRGDYWLTQQLCKTICGTNNIIATVEEDTDINWDRMAVNGAVIEALDHNYAPPVTEFCRGRRFRPTNDPYFKLLKCLSEQDRSNVDLNDLANRNPDIKGSINNVKDHRLSVLLKQKPDCARLFYYDSATKNFALEDPALFFYLRHLDWTVFRRKCGFRKDDRDLVYDVAISFAGENRALAEFIYEQLGELDISVFYDRNYEDNYLGGPWSRYFRQIFVEESRLVVAILDVHHLEKVWPTFERDCFQCRVKAEEVIPIRLDDTVFPGLPGDLVAIKFEFDGDVPTNRDRIIDDVVLRIAAKLDNM